MPMSKSDGWDPIEALRKDKELKKKLAEESEMSEKKWEGELEPEFGIDLFNACMAGAKAALARIEKKDGRTYSRFEEIPEDSLYYDEAFNLYRGYGRLANMVLARTWYLEGGCNKNYGARWLLRYHMQFLQSFVILPTVIDIISDYNIDRPQKTALSPELLQSIKLADACSTTYRQIEDEGDTPKVSSKIEAEKVFNPDGL
ncbi:hypothetical protein GTA08_BOTSDO13102 [Botryosphaeria dothidea]|uniref:Uncharacterized protein n=1 Tax=Botryosphaeria dothidea TaxID=55169 RepID=A0A8H4N8Q2_9PEZI|nr:hypothetical protein GTA08_BOTSDO13102 [Botryosphaeria dothidea]